MAVEIKITGETAEKAHHELQSLANLVFGAPRTPKLALSIPLVQDALENPVPEPQETQVAQDKPKTTRSRKAKVEETPVVEVQTEETPENPPVVETKEEPTDESDLGNEGPKYDNKDFADCTTDEEVLNKTRTFLAEVNQNPANQPKARAIFASYGVTTVPKLSMEQVMDFYYKLKAI